MLELTGGAGLVFRFCSGRMLHSGVDKVVAVLTYGDNPEACGAHACRAFTPAAEYIGWDSLHGHLLTHIRKDVPVAPVRGSGLSKRQI